MKKYKEWTLGVISILGLIILSVAFAPDENKILYNHPLDNMPVVDGPVYKTNTVAPQEDRGEEYRTWLAASVRVKVGKFYGSGTICYYDAEKKEAWVISCGHLWSGTKNAGALNMGTAEISAWYHNEKKLAFPKKYKAKVIFYSNTKGYDVSLLKFTPDWEPEYFTIAQSDYKIEVGKTYHSTGCDSSKEVARYEVEILTVGSRPGVDTRAKKNSPRPGRSGGGLLTNDGYYIGTCWGTTDKVNGNGQGIFTSIPSIRKHFKSQGYEWLLNLTPPNGARTIPIIDRNNPGARFPIDYIPFPFRNMF